MTCLLPFTCLRAHMNTPLLYLKHRFSVFPPLLCSAFLLAGLSGCSSVSSMLEPEKIDYKSATQTVKKSGLEVPPDLTQLKADNRYATPDGSARGTATASSFNAESAGKTGAAKPAEAVDAAAPKQTADMRIERSGNQRWLVVKQSPELLWPRIKDFWQENGFLLNIELPEAGVMETDWAENRAKIPQDFIRSALGKVMDSLYSTGERDKFRTRLERNADGSTEIFISHRGAAEVTAGQLKERTVWTPRAPDPELEAEFLGRMMVRLGTEEKVAKAAVAAAQPAPLRARIEKDKAGAFVKIDEAFDRAWRRVGLALDRVGFTVEDRDRSRGLYFVRYVDQGSDAENKTSEPGFFSRLFSSKDDKKSALRYRIVLKPDGDVSRLRVLDDQGAPTTSANADRILTLLNDQLK